MLGFCYLNYVVEINWEIYLKVSIDKCNLEFSRALFNPLYMFVM